MNVRFDGGQWWVFVNGTKMRHATANEVFTHAPEYQYGGLPDIWQDSPEMSKDDDKPVIPIPAAVETCKQIAGKSPFRQGAA